MKYSMFENYTLEAPDYRTFAYETFPHIHQSKKILHFNHFKAPLIFSSLYFRF